MHPQIEVRPLIIHIQASLNQTLTLQDFTRTPSSPPSKAVAHLSDQQWYGECGLPNLQFEYDFGVAIAIASDKKNALLGVIQSVFEGLMYTFVFLCTPSLSPPPMMRRFLTVFIFVTFILASMLGSSLASRLMARSLVFTQSRK
ncbi:hypothetical protein V6N12_045520 [Hibiscus sabdariffa]|uniref:Uncharacterized protein n=1 Tax=Hibiscus sabdariffa TaxID=183260 RepID=A0ABR2G3W8_9ROSI